MLEIFDSPRHSFIIRLCFSLNVLSTTSSLSAIAHHKKTPFAVTPRQGFLGTYAFTGKPLNY